MIFPKFAEDRDLRRSPAAWLMLVFLVIYCFMELRWGRIKLLWFDETCTLMTSHEPTLRQMFLAEPADGNPPLMYFLTRISLKIFGVTQFALRLPEMLGLVTAVIGSYVFAGRRYGASCGLLAAALVISSPIGDFAVEGRPYGLMAGLVTLSLVFWQRAAEHRPKRTGALVGLALSLFALILAHPFGMVFAAVPLLAGEAMRVYKTRTLDRGTALSILAGFSALAIALPMDAAIHQVMVHYAGKLTAGVAAAVPGKLATVVRLTVLGIPWVFLWPLAGAAFLAHRNPSSENAEKSEPGAPAHEWAAVVGLASMIFVVWLIAAVATHYFFARYTFVACVGVSLVLAMLCGRIPGKHLILPAMAISFLWFFVWTTRDRIHNSTPGIPSEQTLLSLSAPDEPVVVASALDFPMIWWHSGPPLRARLHYVADLQQALTTPDFVPELYLIAQQDKHVLPYDLDQKESFLQAHRTFLLMYRENYPNGSEWLPHELQQRHDQFRLLLSEDGYKLAEVRAP